MSRRRGLSPEEEALWRKAMRDVAPYRTKKHVTERLVSEAQSPGVKTSKGPNSLLKPRHVAPPGGGEAIPLPRRAQHPFAAGDPRLDKLAGRGRLPIDGVLDLHGHSQRTAEGALRRFITEGHARGLRCLLVITGKGAPDLAEKTPLRSWDAPGGRGVLRARLSDWLAEEPLRRLVSRASPAHQRHGGAGAFYIFLKR